MAVTVEKYPALGKAVLLNETGNGFAMEYRAYTQLSRNSSDEEIYRMINGLDW